MIYCNECVYPAVAVLLDIGGDGTCSACRAHKEFSNLSEESWNQKKELFKELIFKHKGKSYYDCVIPVSGGKDSYYQAHIICEKYNLKPLLVTYDHNNWLPEGEHNRNQMKKKFDADHITWSPSEKVLKKLNRLSFEKIGDMNWHDHCGIMTAPVIVATRFKIPLMIWGESPWDISGQFGPDDMVNFTNRSRHENSLRGYEWYDFINDKNNPLTEKDMAWAKYPTDEEILSVGVTGIYIGSYFKWSGKKNAELSIKKYDWQPSKTPFERTYRNYSNVDNRYSNGVSDMLKFIKFGYGRSSDHVSKDIRNGEMIREDGIKLIKKYDPVISSDLSHFLEYVELKETDFWKIADKFRDPRVWIIKNKQWYKDNIWGEESAYGDVYLNKNEQENFNIRKKI